MRMTDVIADRLSRLYHPHIIFAATALKLGGGV